MDESALREQVRAALRVSLSRLENTGQCEPGTKVEGTRVVDYLSRENPFRTATTCAVVPQASDYSGKCDCSGECDGSGRCDRAVPSRDPAFLQRLRDSTPARIAVGRTGSRPLTDTLLTFRADHAAAVDAVFGELDAQVLSELGLFPVQTMAQDKHTYLRRPDLGRRLTPESVQVIKDRCFRRPQVQIVVSDGLSSEAIASNLRDVLPSLLQSLQQHGLKIGTPFYVSKGRVAVMDEIGELLQPEALVLLIGERPGLVAADSMSAYLCYQPNRNTVEADRMVVSNIHKGGTPPVEAGAHLGAVLKRILEKQASGVKLANMP